MKRQIVGTMYDKLNNVQREVSHQQVALNP